MELVFLNTGKTEDLAVEQLMITFEKRLEHFVRYKRIELPQVKLRKPSPQQLLEAESEIQLKSIQPSDFLILMDENGKAYNSRAFAQQLQKWLNAGHRRMVFLIGGAYGFHQNVIDRADHKMRLSDMTFNHQVVRILFCEQLYRAFAILNNHPYHND